MYFIFLCVTRFYSLTHGYIVTPCGHMQYCNGERKESVPVPVQILLKQTDNDKVVFTLSSV